MPCRLLAELSLLPLPPYTKLHHPRCTRKQHTRNRHPRQDTILRTPIRVHTDLISILVDDIRRLILHNLHNNRRDEQCDESKRSETPVAETDEPGPGHEECDCGSEDCEPTGCDPNCVEDEGCVESDV